MQFEANYGVAVNINNFFVDILVDSILQKGIFW